MSRIAYSVALTAVAISWICLATESVLAAGQFKRLNAAEIHNRIIGNVVTDGSHWADRFKVDGELDGMELGLRKPGTWKLRGNQMCVMRKSRKPVVECFEIWQSGDEIEYRGEGVTMTSGTLRKE